MMQQQQTQPRHKFTPSEKQPEHFEYIYDRTTRQHVARQVKEMVQ